jgi:hypothetical protein
MRINIKTDKPVKDSEMRAMYIIGYAFKLISPRMIKPTLDFFAGHFGYKVTGR